MYRFKNPLEKKRNKNKIRIDFSLQDVVCSEPRDLQ